MSVTPMPPTSAPAPPGQVPTPGPPGAGGATPSPAPTGAGTGKPGAAMQAGQEFLTAMQTAPDDEFFNATKIVGDGLMSIANARFGGPGGPGGGGGMAPEAGAGAPPMPPAAVPGGM